MKETESSSNLIQEQNNANNLRYGLVLLIILLVGTILRIYNLSHESVWLDEGFSVLLAKLSLSKMVIATAKDVHPPLYYFLLHFWIILFGTSEFSIRFMSVIPGVFTIYMSYKIGELIFNKEVGLVSALLLSLSTFNIYYSQEARMYSLMTALTLTSFYYYFVMLLKRRSAAVLICYIFFSVLLMYTHVYGLFIIIAQNIYFLVSLLILKKQLKYSIWEWIGFQLILVLFFSPWIYILIHQIFKVEKNFWIPVPPLTKLVGPFITYSGSIPLFFLFIFFSLFMLFSFREIETGDSQNNSYKFTKALLPSLKSYDLSLILIWLLTPIILPFIISRISTPIYMTRYTIGASLAFYILVAGGVSKIPQRILKFGVVSLIIFLCSISIWKYYGSVNKPQWRDIANYVDSQAKAKDLVLFNEHFIQGPFDYYSWRKDLIKEPISYAISLEDSNKVKKLTQNLKGYNRIWLIQNETTNNKELIDKAFGSAFNAVYRKNYSSFSFAIGKTKNIEVKLYTKK